MHMLTTKCFTLYQVSLKKFHSIQRLSEQHLSDKHLVGNRLFQYNLGVVMMVFAILEGIAAAVAVALCWQAVWGCRSMRPLV